MMEGKVEFRSILFVLATRKDDIGMTQKIKNIRLYIKRVFTSDDFDGELVRIMRNRVVRKAFDMILYVSLNENRDDYDKFWENFGKFLKLGCIEDHSNHKRITPLLRFFSSQSEDEYISLDEYMENMKPEQKDFYYIAADSVTSAKNTPFLERLLQKDYEVVFLVDPMDEVAITNLKSYKEKNFIDISKEVLYLLSIDTSTLKLGIIDDPYSKFFIAKNKFLQKYDLLGKLRSLKRYLLLDQMTY